MISRRNIINSKNTPVIIAVSLAVLVILVGAMTVLTMVKWQKYDRYDKKDFIDQSTYQAVFLTNDQIYFGHLKNISSDYLILSDAHYVKVNEEGDAQIVKLGVVEPHSPQDKMTINQDQVLFWENLKASSPVIETIKKLQLQQ